MTIATYTSEFPDFDPATMPAIPTGYEDTSWHNDACPNFTNAAKRLAVFIDYEDPSQREFPDCPRFTVHALDVDGSHCAVVLADFNDWPTCRAYLDAPLTPLCAEFAVWIATEGIAEKGDALELLMSDRTPEQRAYLSDFITRWDAIEAATRIGNNFAARLRDVFTDAEFSEMRRRNATPDYGGDVCASHDFCDANEIMAAAFEAETGRPLALGDDEPGQQADFALWGAAWNHAKTTHLTA